MLWTLARHAEPTLASALKKLLPQKLPPSLYDGPGTLYEILSRTPAGGIGREVHQVRWSHKQIANCWWKVTRTQFKCEGKHGKAWGHLYWRGKCWLSSQTNIYITPCLGKQVSNREERIRGSLKYTWSEGRSEALSVSTPKSLTWK